MAQKRTKSRTRRRSRKSGIKIGGKRIRLTPMGKILILVLIALILILPTATAHNHNHRAAQSSDKVCYLAAKYESNSHAESVGEDVAYQAYGEYQLYYAYELVPFVNWCYEKDPAFYESFKDYREMSRETIPGEDFRNVWKGLAEADYSKFEEDQQSYLIEHTLADACANLTEAYGFDFARADDALKACVLSIANRDGKYIKNLEKYFHATTKESTEEEIIRNAYAEIQYYRSGERRWIREEEDCLAMLRGELDVYAKSENDAGGIDWRWKK